MPKGTFRAKVTSNSEKIKPIALAVIELHLSEGSQLRQSVEKYIKNYKFKNEVGFQVIKSSETRDEAMVAITA